MNLTATKRVILAAPERSALIRLASTLPQGSEGRRTVLRTIKTAFLTPEAEALRLGGKIGSWVTLFRPALKRADFSHFLKSLDEISGDLADLSRLPEGSRGDLVREVQGKLNRLQNPDLDFVVKNLTRALGFVPEAGRVLGKL